MRPSTAVARDSHADPSPPGAGGADSFAYRFIEDIETDLGLPVISNITSQLYLAFKAIGMREKIDGFGKLLRMFQRGVVHG